MVMFTCKGGILSGDAEGEGLQRKAGRGDQKLCRRKPVVKQTPMLSGAEMRREKDLIFDEKVLFFESLAWLNRGRS
jgi:hypothetical protein